MSDGEGEEEEVERKNAALRREVGRGERNTGKGTHSSSNGGEVKGRPRKGVRGGRGSDTSSWN